MHEKKILLVFCWKYCKPPVSLAGQITAPAEDAKRDHMKLVLKSDGSRWAHKAGMNKRVRKWPGQWLSEEIIEWVNEQMFEWVSKWMKDRDIEFVSDWVTELAWNPHTLEAIQTNSSKCCSVRWGTREKTHQPHEWEHSAPSQPVIKIN